ncbi:MAG: dihydrodipicolinate synthase family protein [Candidatus Carsonella ruddii]
MINVIAMVTPFKKNGKINWKNFNFLINYFLFNKIKIILLLGTTGESHNFNKIEIINLLIFIKKYNIYFLFNINKKNIRCICYYYYLLKINYISIILFSLPCYIIPNYLNLYKYYKIINKFGIKNIFYNIPKRNCININYKLFLKFKIKKFLIYMKNSINNVKNNLIYKNLNIILFSGNDDNIYLCKKNNYYGTISVINNLIPILFFKINKKSGFLIKKINFNINPILIKFFLYKNKLINGNYNLLLFDTEKYFFYPKSDLN